MTLQKGIFILWLLGTALLIGREFALNDREREMVEPDSYNSREICELVPSYCK